MWDPQPLATLTDSAACRRTSLPYLEVRTNIYVLFIRIPVSTREEILFIIAYIILKITEQNMLALSSDNTYKLISFYTNSVTRSHYGEFFLSPSLVSKAYERSTYHLGVQAITLVESLC
jgi:hypothetical protein